MPISYEAVMQRSRQRARRMLFPFRLETWLTLAFAAFMAEPFLGGSGFNFHSGRWNLFHRMTPGWPFGAFWQHPMVMPEPLRDILALWWPWLLALGVLVTAVAIVVLWVSSRGRFVLLDNVVRERVAIVEPWRNYARLGDSLFLWQLVLMAILGVVGLAVALPWIVPVHPGGFEPDLLPRVALTVIEVSVLAPLALFLFFLLEFGVVPLMYRHGVTTNAAWRRLLPLLRAHLGTFILFALLVLLLYLALSIVLVAAGLLTCCVGFLLFALPYVRHVILLPVYVFFRGLGPDFLAQFGPEYDVFQAAPPAAGSAPAAGPAPAPPADTGA